VLADPLRQRLPHPPVPQIVAVAAVAPEGLIAASDRIIVMNDAVISQEGTPRDLYEAPANGFVADFIGEANIFDCDIIVVVDCDAEIRVGNLTRRHASRGLTVGPAKVAVRPNRIVLHEAGTPNTLAGVVTKATYVGSHAEFTLTTDQGEIFATSLDTDVPYTVQQTVGVGFARVGPVLLTG
jgi:iron(III) transport system ATP-binding protein